MAEIRHKTSFKECALQAKVSRSGSRSGRSADQMSFTTMVKEKASLENDYKKQQSTCHHLPILVLFNECGWSE